MQINSTFTPSFFIESMRVIRGETSSRNSYQRSAQGNVSVQEASPDGKYIVVSNTHRSKQEPIGEWKIKRVIDHKHEVVFTFPKSFVLKPGQSVKIWARGHGTNNPPESIVFNGAESFGTGNNVQTILYNTSDEVNFNTNKILLFNNYFRNVQHSFNVQVIQLPTIKTALLSHFKKKLTVDSCSLSFL